MQTTAAAFSWVWLVLLAGATSAPLGGAPLPLDPALSAIAPEECLWYASYSGQGEANPASENQTEQLFAEPQVLRLAEEIETQLMRAIRRAGGPEREKRVLVEQIPKLVCMLLTRPSAAYIEEVKPKKDGVEVSAAIVLNAGDQKDEVDSAIEKLIELIPPDNRKFEIVEEDGVKWRRVLTPPHVPEIRLGWKDEYLILSIGKETPAKLFKRMDGSAPKWLSAIREEHPIERELSLGYLNVAGAMEILRPIAEAKDPKAWPVVEKLGLTSIRAIHGVSGYDEVACKSIAHIVTDGGKRPGLLGLLPHSPLEKSDLLPIPKDALMAVAAKLDAAALWDHGVETASQIEPKAREHVERGLWEVETKLGVSIRDDILGSLGDAWVAYLPSGDLMVSWLNSAVAARVDDADALNDAVKKMIDLAKAELSRDGKGVSIGESELGDHTIYTLQLPAPVPVAPSLCVGDDWIVLSLTPQAVRSALERKAEDSLADNTVVASALEGKGGVAALAYQDTPRLVESIYPWLQIGVQMAAGALRKQGIEFDSTALPAKEVVLKHLQPSIATIRHADDGFHFTSWHSLPGGGNLAAAAPVGVGLLLPAVRSARYSAQQAADMNSMKQIGLAMHMYVDATKQLPTDIYSKDGKPLFSWRVRLLPYLEQQAVYQQLKLDEPWDSEHNRRVTATRLPIFESRTASHSGRTRFLALQSPGAMLGGKVEIGFKDVTDGLSHTIAFVEAAPDRAVEWAKPADLKFDPDQPWAGLASPDGSVLVAMGDGSVRRLAADTNPEAIKAYATRAGGEQAP